MLYAHIITISYYINHSQIFNDIHINDFITDLNIKQNSSIFNYLKSYKFKLTFIAELILENFCDLFYK